MARKFVTPPTPPGGFVSRQLAIPADKLWLGVFSEALSQTIYPYNYIQVDPANLTPEETAEIAQAVYFAWLEAGECQPEECPPPTLPDGSKIYRKNPTTGHWEYLDDDWETWVEPSGDDTLSPPAERTEQTTDDKLCAAATNAVNAYYHLWLELVDQWNNEVEPDLAYAAFAIETGLTLGAPYYPPLAAVSSLVGLGFSTFFFLFEQMTSQTWNDQFIDKLVCIFLDNATLQADDTVTFAHDNIIWEVNGTFWSGQQSALQVTQFTYLMQLLGAQATNRAGGLTAVSGDCATCGEWCYTFDFSEGTLGWSPMRETNSYYSAYGVHDGTKFVSTTAISTGSGYEHSICLGRAWDETTLTGITVTYNRTNGQFTTQIYAQRVILNNSDNYVPLGTRTTILTALTPGSAGTGLTYSASGTWTGIKGLTLTLVSSYRQGAVPNPAGNCAITSITLTGTGANPFGQNNC